MKKTFLITLVLITLINLMPNMALATNPLTIKVNGETITFPDVQPYINSEDRTLVPGRFIFEKLGCTVDYLDNGVNGEFITITRASDKLRIVLQIGKNYAVVNKAGSEKKVEFDTSPELKTDESGNTRTMIPLRFVSETIGEKVEYYEWSNIVTVGIDNEPKVNKDIEYNRMESKDLVNYPEASAISKLPCVYAVSRDRNVYDSINVSFGENNPKNNNILDPTLDIYVLKDLSNITISVARYSDLTISLLKECLNILYPDNSDLQKKVMDNILAFRTNPQMQLFNLDDNHEFFIKSTGTTWTGDEKFGVYAKIMKRSR